MLVSHLSGRLQSETPCLVFLHGLLGSGEDWHCVIDELPEWPCLTVDLPGHGDSQQIAVTDFDDVCKCLDEVLNYHQIDSFVLIGYSLGGRIAMYYRCCYSFLPGLQALVIEGGNLGLTCDEQRETRLLNDSHWATRFATEPLPMVLDAWYRQPVFANLDEDRRAQFVAKRQNNNGKTIAAMLLATSLAKQPWLGEKIGQLQYDAHVHFAYFCGELDNKFCQLAKHHRLALNIIKKAGHNAHRSNPVEFARQLRLFLKEC